MSNTPNKLIAKNTLVLYFRSILMMFIGLYTSRVILQALGITNFGIYNAVGGIVAMFGFISASLGNATSRFITIAIGKGNQEEINKTFGNIKIIYYSLCILVLLFGETLGVWFLYNKMVIPPERLGAAFWVLQYSILSTIVGFICVPYNSAIIAHEKMSAFAYISLLDVIMKLIICFLIQIIPFDKLIVYATLFFIVELIDRLIYAYYCNKNFEEVHAPARLYREQFREILSISGWTLSGNILWILNTQGVNLILNIFFGPVVNAARGIALQVQGVMGQFVSNFQTAINPQITKSYAVGDYNRLHKLLQTSSKFSFLLMFTMGMPIFFEAPLILSWWLHEVPEHTVIFLRIILIYAVFSTLSNPLWIAVLATGKLKKYQIYDNVLQALVLPIAYIVFKFLHVEPYWIFIILFASELIEIVIRCWILLPLIKHNYSDYIKRVVLPLALASITASILPMLIFDQSASNFSSFILVCSVCIVSALISIYFLGLTKMERIFIIGKLRNLLKV